MSQTARLLAAAAVVLMVLHLAAMGLDEDFRSLQGAGGLGGLPRLLAPFAGVLAYIAGAPLLARYARRSLLVRVVRVVSPLAIATLFGALLIPASKQPLLAGVEAAAFWVALALAVQPVNLNRILGGSRLVRLAGTPTVVLGLSVPWLLHFAVFTFLRDRCVTVLDSARALTDQGAYAQSLETLATAPERCGVPRRLEEAGEVREHLYTRWEESTLAQARDLLASGAAEQAEQAILTFLANEGLGDHQAAPTVLLGEVRVVIGDQLLTRVTMLRESGGWDEALDQARAFLTRLPNHPRRAEGVELEASLEQEAARATELRVVGLIRDDPNQALALARASESRYPDEYPKGRIGILRVQAADAALAGELTKAQTEEDYERYDAALALLDPLAQAYPEAQDVGTASVRAELIRTLPGDPGLTLMRSYWFRQLSPLSVFGKSPEWLTARLPDLELRSATLNKLQNELLPFCREVDVEGTHLYTACFSAWDGKLMELYVHFPEHTDMNAVIQALMGELGPFKKTNLGVYWSKAGAGIEVLPSKEVLTYYSMSLKKRYDKRRKRL